MERPGYGPRSTHDSSCSIIFSGRQRKLIVNHTSMSDISERAIRIRTLDDRTDYALLLLPVHAAIRAKGLHTVLGHVRHDATDRVILAEGEEAAREVLAHLEAMRQSSHIIGAELSHQDLRVVRAVASTPSRFSRSSTCAMKVTPPLRKFPRCPNSCRRSSLQSVKTWHRTSIPSTALWSNCKTWKPYSTLHSLTISSSTISRKHS